jgi:nucleotide-binding universal stress UspA family protein
VNHSHEHDRTTHRVLLAVDLAGSAAAASAGAIERARQDHADLVVLSVLDPHNLHLAGSRTKRVDQERDRLALGAQAIVRRARDVGVPATYLIWEGDPADTILEATAAEGADLIVMGSRARTNLRRLLLGSVSSEVARRAQCEVLVVPS